MANSVDPGEAANLALQCFETELVSSTKCIDLLWCVFCNEIGKHRKTSTVIDKYRSLPCVK